MGKLQLKKSGIKTPKDYGIDLYIVKVIKSLSPNEEMSVWADGVQVENGDLIFLHDRNGTDEITLSIAQGNWKAFYLAEENFQFPVSVERWQGVAGVRIVEREVPGDVDEREVPVVYTNPDGSCRFCGHKEPEGVVVLDDGFVEYPEVTTMDAVEPEILPPTTEETPTE